MPDCNRNFLKNEYFIIANYEELNPELMIMNHYWDHPLVWGKYDLRTTGLEPVAYGLKAHHSNQLSYAPE